MCNDIGCLDRSKFAATKEYGKAQIVYRLYMPTLQEGPESDYIVVLVETSTLHVLRQFFGWFYRWVLSRYLGFCLVHHVPIWFPSTKAPCSACEVYIHTAVVCRAKCQRRRSWRRLQGGSGLHWKTMGTPLLLQATLSAHMLYFTSAYFCHMLVLFTCMFFTCFLWQKC